jgi:hypothetical protein
MSRSRFGILLACAIAATGAPLAQSMQIRLPGAATFILPAHAGRSLLSQCSRGAPAGVSRFWSPSTEQIQRLESLLPGYVRAEAGADRRIPDNVEYHRQYIGIVVNDRRLIYGNFYPASVLDLFLDARRSDQPRIDEKSTPVVVCDGGPSFWGIVFDPESNEFRDLQTNGPI